VINGLWNRSKVDSDEPLLSHSANAFEIDADFRGIAKAKQRHGIE
jgi:hypothetical protein